MRRPSWLLVIPFLVVGCSGDGFKLVPSPGGSRRMANCWLTCASPSSRWTARTPVLGSAGTTDATRYTLVVSSQQYSGNGAVVGRHRVSIGTVLPGEGDKPTDPSVGSPDGRAPGGQRVNTAAV